MLKVRRFDSQSSDFEAQFNAFVASDQDQDDDVTQTVQQIINAIRTRGNEALLDYTQQFDRLTLASAAHRNSSRSGHN